MVSMPFWQDVSLIITPAEDDRMQLQKPKEEHTGTKRKTLNQKPEVPKKMEIISFQGKNVKSLESDEKPSTSIPLMGNLVKHEKSEEDFAFDEPPFKKIKSTTCPEGKPVKNLGGNKVKEELEMNWDIVQVGDLFLFYGINETISYIIRILTYNFSPLGISWSARESLCC